MSSSHCTRSSNPLRTTRFGEEGRRCANFLGNASPRTPGIITRVHDNNTYNIRFEDGTDVQCVESSLIRFRLQSRVSILMQGYALAFLAFATLTPFTASIFFLTSYSTYTLQRDSALASGIMVPLLLVSLWSWLGHAIQVALTPFGDTGTDQCVRSSGAYSPKRQEELHFASTSKCGSSFLFLGTHQSMDD